MALFIEIKSADGLVSRTRLEPGKNRFTVRLGDNYRILDDQTGRTPDGIAVKRIDNNLLVDGLDSQQTTVEFADFYNVCSAGSPCELTVETGSGGAPIAITPGTQPIGALADGSFVLYDPNFAETAPAAPSLGDGTALRYGLYGLGGLAVAGLALSGGGGGDGGGSSGVRSDGALKLTSSEFVNSRTPTITGEGEAGARITVRIDTDGNGTPDVTYATVVGADSRWSVNLATAQPESGALPGGGLPNASNVGITSTTPEGNASLPTFVLTFDGTPPAAAVIAPIATDNLVNASEKASGFAITGTAEPGTVVVLTLNSQALASADVGADGQWRANISGASVPADGAYTLSAVVQDRAGNLSSPTSASLGIDSTVPGLQIASIAGGDSAVAIADAGSVSFSGTTEPNAQVVVQWNGDKSVVADGNGNWTLSYTGAEVPDVAGAPNGVNFPYAVTATDRAGNASAAQTGMVLVDRVAPGAPTVATVEGDNNVTVAERADGVPVSGTAEAGSRVEVSWGAVTLATTATNGQWSVLFGPNDTPASGSGAPQTSTLRAVAFDDVSNASAPTDLAVTVERPFSAPTIGVVEGNDVVNALERSDGVTLSGTVQAGAAGVSVAWGAFSGAAAVSGTSWSLNLAPGQVPADGNTTVTATVTGAGGGAAGTRGVRVDTTAPPNPVVDPIVTNIGNVGDTRPDSISFAEEQVGVVVTGTAEAGSTVIVELGTVARFVTAGGDGRWSTAASPFTDAEIPNDSPSLLLRSSATDAAGNSSTLTSRSIAIETVTPGPPPAADAPLQTLKMSELLSASDAARSQPALPGGSQDPAAWGQSEAAAYSGSFATAPVASSSALASMLEEPHSGGRYA